MIPSIWTTAAIVTAYLVVVIGGQKVMKNREPFQLKHPMMVYNFCLVVLNAYIFYEVSGFMEIFLQNLMKIKTFQTLLNCRWYKIS